MGDARDTFPNASLADVLKSADFAKSVASVNFADLTKGADLARTIDFDALTKTADIGRGINFDALTKTADIGRGINFDALTKGADLARTIDFDEMITATNAARTIKTTHLAEAFKSIKFDSGLADFSKALGSTSWAEAFKLNSLDDLVSQSTFPRARWDALLNDLRTSGIPNRTVDELEDVEVDTFGEPVERESWLFRLTFLQQMGLAVAALKVLDEVGKFLADVAGEDVPTEVRSATQVLFAVVVFLLLAIELRSDSKD